MSQFVIDMPWVGFDRPWEPVDPEPVELSTPNDPTVRTSPNGDEDVACLQRAWWAAEADTAGRIL